MATHSGEGITKVTKGLVPYSFFSTKLDHTGMGMRDTHSQYNYFLYQFYLPTWELLVSTIGDGKSCSIVAIGAVSNSEKLRRNICSSIGLQ